MRFLGIVLRILRLEVSVCFLNHREEGAVLYQVYLLSPLQSVTHCRNCKRFREFIEIEISRQSCRGDCELQGEQ
jgi:hypothetical protein